MNKITQDFYQAKTIWAVHRWFSPLCLTVALWLGSMGQVMARRYMMLFFVLLTSVLGVQNVMGQTNNPTGFEDNAIGSWVFGGGTADADSYVQINSNPTFVRTGTYSFLTFEAGTGTRYGENTTFAVNTNATYIYCHAIVWMKAGTGTTMTGNAGLARSGSSSNGTLVAINNTSWVRTTISWSQASQSVYPRLRKSALAGGAYFDDVVIYTSTNATTDITAPSSATAASGTTTNLSWTNGADTGTGATGLQATLIFKRTAGTVGANDLSLNSQGVYSLTSTQGPSVAGNWTLQNGAVSSGATSYAGSFTSGEEYAIVHRDLAYNYSSPTYVVIPVTGPVISTIGNFSAVTETYGGTPFTTSFINVSGTSMNAGISVNPPVGFQVSTDSDFSVPANIGTNGSPITVGAAGTILSTAVYVRLLPTATVAGSPYSGNVEFSSSGATSINKGIPSSTVTAKALTITGLTGNSRPYNGSATATLDGIGTTAAFVGLVSPDSFSVPNTYTATFANANAADNKGILVSGFPAPSTNYTVTQPTGLTANIFKVDLTITAGNQSVTYGTAASAVTAAGTYTPTGFVNSETASVITGAPSYTTSYTDTTDAATSGVTITPAVGSLTATNYNFTTFVDGTITITKANSSISITGGSPTYAYDGNPQGPTTSSVTGSSGTVSYLYTNTSGPAYSSSTPPSNAGAYQVVATVDPDTNYNGASSAPYAFSIISATMPEITSVLTASATYGVAAATYTITGTFSPTTFDAVGLPAGLSVNTSTGEITGTPTALPGDYNVTISATNGTGTGDDILVYTILAKELTVSSAVADDKVYNSEVDATFTGTLVGVVNSDDVSLNGTGTFAQETVGTAIVVTSTATLSGAKAAYYILTDPTGLSADITPKELTVSGAVVTSKTYTGTADATITGASLVGVISGDTVTLVNNGGTFADVNVANGISVTSAFSLTGAHSGNYTVAQPSLTGNITPASLTITGLTGDNKPYDGDTDASFTGTPEYSGLQNGETFAVTGTPVASFATATAGDGKAITVNGYTAPSANYTVTAPTLTGNITKVALTITANNQSVGYGTAAAVVTAAGTYTATGFVNSETASVISGAASYTTSYTNATAVGASGITITPAQGTLAATNYSFGTFVDGTITVTLGTQTITLASTATKIVGFADYSPATSPTSGINPITYTSSNPLVATVVNEGTQIHYVGLGTTTITASQAASANYNAAADVSQTLTVAKAKILYATLTKTLSGTGASTVTNDAIIRMLSSDPNFEVTVSSTDITGTTLPALSGFNLVVVQESFGGTNGILLPPSGKLAIRNLSIPVIYNKTFALQNARAVTATSTVSDTSFLSVDVTGNTTNPLYSGMDVSSNSIPLLKTTSDDNASTSATGKGISIVNNLALSNTGTLKATVTSITDVTKGILINDIPAGTQLGTNSLDVTPSRMITFGFNFGALCESDGKNLTNEMLTLWRNAAYILTGQTPPSALYLNPDNDQSITFGALPTKKVGDSPFALTATSAQTPNSGNPITYTSSNNTTVASVTGSTVTILGRGTTTITASQAGGGSPAYWYAAPSVQQNLVVNAAAPVITGSYCVGGTTVSGTSTEPDGTDIKVYKAGSTQIGATTVTGGAWSVTVPALATGDSLTATAGEGLLYVSAPSTAKVVNALPVVTASNVSGCPNTDIALIGSPVGGTFSITNPYNGNVDTTYTYTYTDGNGCTNTSGSATVTLGV
ncbi:YDG domain-containing protein, partial [Flavobacterium sp. AS60]|uniref:beta strand repeat-containing protein n=1 Tax=Flavobacterium anseongense TaxID=2910677 RepID=UPI001F275E7F